MIPLLIRLLSRVAGERHGPLAVWVAMAKELLQFERLGISEGVHRVDDDRLNTLMASAPEYAVNDGNNVGKTFT